MSSGINGLSCLSPHYNYVNKRTEIKSKIAELSSRIDRNIDPYVLVNKEISPAVYASGKPESSAISVPYLFLIKSVDLPSEFRIADANDPRLQSDDFLQRAANWSKDFLGLDRQHLSFENKEVLRVFLKFFSNPVLSEKAKEFVLNHEISHIFFRHSHGSSSPVRIIKEAIFPKRSVSPLVVTIGATSIIALGAGFSIIATLLGITASSTFCITLKVFQAAQNSRACEKDADLNAVKYSRAAAEGGIYLFEVMRDHYRSARYTNFLTWLCYSSTGNFRPRYVTHPTENERIGYLRERLSQFPTRIT